MPGADHADLDLIHPDGLLEYVEAERIEDDGNGWSFWSVVLIISDPRWSCVRRVSAADVIGEPLPVFDAGYWLSVDANLLSRQGGP